MSFLTLLIGIFLLYEFDDRIHGKRRFQSFRETLEQFEEHGLDIHLNKVRGQQVGVYKDKSLEIIITKKRNKIEIKVYFHTYLSGNDLVQHIIYDETRNEITRDMLFKDALEDYWGESTHKAKEFNRLRPLLVRQANQWFGTDIPVEEVTKATSTPVTEEETKTTSPLVTFDALLNDGAFEWSEKDALETYKTTDGAFLLQMNKETNELHHITIHHNGSLFVQFTYNPQEKSIHDLDIHKTVLHTLKDPEQFVATLEKVLFFCYEKTNQKQQKIDSIIERFNQKPYRFLSKEKDLLQRIDFIEENRNLLNTEEKHLLDTIRSVKIPEIMTFKQKMSNDPSIEEELLKMMTILSDVLDTLSATVTREQNMRFQVKERLMQNLKEDNE